MCNFSPLTNLSMPTLPVSLLCADIGLGKMDPSMLSDQARMELFVENISDAFRAYFQMNGTFLDMCEWPGMSCDEEGNITGVSLLGADGGTVCLDYFPEKVDRLSICSHYSLAGTLNTANLPSRLEFCDIAANNFDGTVDMTKLPKPLFSLSIAQNKFSGECNLTALPAGLDTLNASENCFSGSLRLDALPEGMNTLDVSRNCFSGSVSLDNLPESLEELQICMNELSGSLALVKPGSLYVFTAHSNRFSGKATIPSRFRDERALVTLGCTNITSVVDETGAAHQFERKFLSSTE